MKDGLIVYFGMDINNRQSRSHEVAVVNKTFHSSGQLAEYFPLYLTVKVKVEVANWFCIYHKQCSTLQQMS